MKLLDPELFLAYAVPCGTVLVKRGTITQDQLDHPSPEMFKVGLFMCEQSAKALGKSAIDKEAIRQYFWLDHDKHLEHAEGDVDPRLCRVYPATYLGENRAKTPIDERNVNISSTPNVKRGDYVTVHYNRTCEAITKSEFDRLLELKK